MKFYPRRRKAAPAIIIISLIDVLIVMLVFLLVSTNFKNQPSVKITLPDATGAPKAGAGPEKPPAVVTIQSTEPHFYFGDRPVTEDRLLAELTAAARDPETRLLARADQNISLNLALRFVKLAGQAGFKGSNIKFAAKDATPK